MTKAETLALLWPFMFQVGVSMMGDVFAGTSVGVVTCCDYDSGGCFLGSTVRASLLLECTGGGWRDLLNRGVISSLCRRGGNSGGGLEACCGIINLFAYSVGGLWERCRSRVSGVNAYSDACVF